MALFLITMTTIQSDRAMAMDRIEEIRSIYGIDFPILVHSDGEITPIQENGGTRFIPGKRIKGVKHGGQWTHRYLERYLETDRDILIKIDPDSKVKRAFCEFPESGDIYGNCYRSTNNKPYIQGGCIGFRREAAKRIVESRILLDRMYRNRLFSLDQGEKHQHRIYSFQDAILFHVAVRMGLRIAPWKEVATFPERLKGRYVPGDYAVIHPISIVEE